MLELFRDICPSLAASLGKLNVIFLSGGKICFITETYVSEGSHLGGFEFPMLAIGTGHPKSALSLLSSPICSHPLLLHFPPLAEDSYENRCRLCS